MFSKTIYEGQDEFGKVRVKENYKERFLLFDTEAAQSAIIKRSPLHSTLKYQHLMQLSALFKLRIKNMLFIGLGGGCMPSFFYNIFPKAQIKVLELRPLVYKVAQQYFYLPSSPRLTVDIVDASRWHFSKYPRNFDIIFLDAYDNQGMPSSINNNFFFEKCYKGLNDEGLLVINFWSKNLQENKNTKIELEKIFAYNYIKSDVEGCDNKIFYLFKNISIKGNLKFQNTETINKIEKFYGVPYSYYQKKLISENEHFFAI